MKRYVIGLIFKLVCRILYVEEIVMICQTIAMVLCRCGIVSEGYMQEKRFFEEMRLEGNDVGIVFVYFSWNFKHVIRRFLRSMFTYDLAEMTRQIANLLWQHRKICAIIKIL